jgi:membrane associated rhomboid family serine protease
MIFTFAILIITVLVSIAAFNNNDIYNKLVLWPRAMANNPTEYHRLLSSGFIHADWNHLIFNMFTFYFFGQAIEYMGIGILFPVLYLTGIIVASIPSFVKHRNNSSYRSLGASGGVSSIVFFAIYFSPWSRISLFFIPIGIPSIVFAALYLVYSAYMARRGSDAINHDAHFWGAVYGILFAVVIDPTHGISFVNELMHPR